ncbi:unnamed protein product [Rotaria magnacalcarata]|uniref:Peptidase C14 caspase domain-containing protein n=2 Tax=Rotaria magnacalcarata TaxID=392030 RepID=A0A816MQW3_9BILA|nr:unnamed protein product [Rotaria magnacalcarata]CAF4387904.1 unnamed protein product [Rotaria magnacalcarata]
MAIRSKVNVMSQPLRKFALVIGIGDYESGEKLNNTQKDARDMLVKLDRMDFISDGPKLDLTCEEMKMALVNYEHSVREGDIVLFYFAGHGTQWEDQNFLISKDDDRMDADEIKNRAILIQKFLDDFNDHHPFVTILLLDCCRVYHLRNPKFKVALVHAKKINNSQSTGLN